MHKLLNKLSVFIAVSTLLAQSAFAASNASVQPISKGGTGASTAATAASNLGQKVVNLANLGLPTGGDDTTAINAALAAAKITGYAVYAPCGVYNHANIITVDSVKFYGDGYCTQFVATDNAGATGTTINLIGTNTEVHSIRHTNAYSGGRSASPSLSSFYILNGTGTKLHDTWTDGVWAEVGIHTRGITNGKVYNNYVTGALSNNMFTRGTTTMGAVKSEFYGNYVVGGGDTCLEFTSFNGVANVLDGTIINSELDIHDNYVETCAAHGLSIVGGININMHDNRVNAPVNNGIYIATELTGGYSTWNATNINLSGNIIEGACSATATCWPVKVTGGNYVAGYLVNNVNIVGNRIYMINQSGGAGAGQGMTIGLCDACSASAISVKNVNITGNAISGGGLGQSGGAGIQMRGVDTVNIVGNSFSDFYAYGIVSTAGNSGSLTITGNSFANLNIGNASAALGAILLNTSGGFSHHTITGNTQKNGANAISNFVVCQSSSVADVNTNMNVGDVTSVGTCQGNKGVVGNYFLAGQWIDMPTTGPSGIGTGGAGINPWIAYVSTAAQYFADSAVADVIIRNATTKNIRIGIDNGTGNATSYTVYGGGFVTNNAAVKQPAAISIGTKFTTSGCSVSSTTGGATAGKFTLGANTCTVVVTMNGATGLTAPNGWACSAKDQTAPTVLIGQSASTATTASFSIPAGAGATDVITFACTGY